MTAREALFAEDFGGHTEAVETLMGQRQTDSGSVVFREVAAGADECMGTPPGTPRASLRSLVSQSILEAGRWVLAGTPPVATAYG